MGQPVGLVGDAIGRAEALGGANGARPFAGVDIRVQGAVSLKAVLFGSVGTHKDPFLSRQNMTPDTKRQFFWNPLGDSL